MEEESRRYSFYKFKEVTTFSEILCKITYVPSVHWSVYTIFTCFHSRLKYMHYQLKLELDEDP